jgi:hypothetical protein
MKRAVLLYLVLAGCVAAPQTESEEGLESAPGKELIATITEDVGWPGGRSVSDDMDVTYQDDQKLEISAPRHVVATSSPLQVAVAQGWGQSVSTSMAFVLYHREVQSGDEWKPVGCSLGSYGTAMVPMSKDGVFMLWEKVKIDGRRFSGFNPLLRDAAFFEFELCGITEANPELGIVALPMSNWWNMADDYSYTLSVSCLDEAGRTTDCPAY